MNRKSYSLRLFILLSCCFAMTAAFPGMASADRGAMSFSPWIDIYEPSQKAIIAWNGQEEFLVLSTDLRASQPTKVLEVLPLPSSPVITRGDVKIFRQINQLINRSLAFNSLSKGPGGRGEGAEITFHEKIGAHDITVVHVLDSGYFEEWVGEYFRKQGVAGYKVSPVMLATIEQYILDGYKWFAFDVVELGTSLKSNDAIQYRFESDKMYYPLRISGNAKGQTDISLTIISRNELTQYRGIPREKFQRLHPAVSVANGELAAIHAEMAEMFNPSEKMFIQTLQLKGDLSEFDLDIVIR